LFNFGREFNAKRIGSDWIVSDRIRSYRSHIFSRFLWSLLSLFRISHTHPLLFFFFLCHLFAVWKAKKSRLSRRRKTFSKRIRCKWDAVAPAAESPASKTTPTSPPEIPGAPAASDYQVKCSGARTQSVRSSR